SRRSTDATWGPRCSTFARSLRSRLGLPRRSARKSGQRNVIDSRIVEIVARVNRDQLRALPTTKVLRPADHFLTVLTTWIRDARRETRNEASRPAAIERDAARVRVVSIL